MREAVLVVPHANNNGAPLFDLRNSVAGELIDAFGGCTIREAHGSWRAPNGSIMTEPVWELVAACEPGPKADATLRNAARRVGREGEQLAVYLRLPSGEVEILDTSAPERIAA